jgi:hypothetical protein
LLPVAGGASLPPGHLIAPWDCQSVLTNYGWLNWSSRDPAESALS